MNSYSHTKAIQSVRLSSPWIGLWNKLSSINFRGRKIFSLCLKVAYTYLSCPRERQTEKVFEKCCTAVNGMVQTTLKNDMRIKVVFKRKVRILNMFAEMLATKLPNILVSSILRKKYFMALSFGCSMFTTLDVTLGGWLVFKTNDNLALVVVTWVWTSSLTGQEGSYLKLITIL